MVKIVLILILSYSIGRYSMSNGLLKNGSKEVVLILILLEDTL